MKSAPVLTERRCRLLVWCVIAPVHAVLVTVLIFRYSPTVDEVAHLPAGLRFWQTGQLDLYLVNPPLVKIIAAAPVTLFEPTVDWSLLEAGALERPEFDIGRHFLTANREQFLTCFRVARLACLPFSLLGLFVCAGWAKDVHGPVAGVAAAVLWTVSPNIVGHAALITPDVPAAAVGVFAMWCCRNWSRSGKWSDAVLSGITLGLAILTKFTLLVLVPLAIGLFFWTRRGQPPQNSLRRLFVQWLVVGMIGLYVMNAGYAFERVGQSLNQMTLKSQRLSMMLDAVAATFIDDLSLPIPAALIEGIDQQLLDFEHGWKPMHSYLRGRQRLGGWWYYYLYAAAVKVPLGLWLLGGCAIVAMFRRRTHRRTFETLWLLLPAMAIVVLVSSHTGFTRHFRYVLPAAPFVIIWLSSVWRSDQQATARPSRMIRRIGAVGVLLAALESGAVYPHSLSFFNLAAGGPANGHRHLLDSNVDWGQDMLALREWNDSRSDDDPLFIAPWGPVLPDDVGIDWKPPPAGSRHVSPLLKPGTYVVSVNHLHGYDSRSGSFEYFLGMPPVDRIGYSLLVYRVPPRTARPAP